MFDELMLPDEAVLQRSPADAAIVRLPIRLPWYRSLPLSCVEGLEIAIDGEAVPPGDLSIGVGGREYSLADAAGQHEVLWFVLDAAQALIATHGPIAPGDHNVAVAVSLRIPYSDPDFRSTRYIQTARGARTVNLVGEDL